MYKINKPKFASLPMQVQINKKNIELLDEKINNIEGYTIIKVTKDEPYILTMELGKKYEFKLLDFEMYDDNRMYQPFFAFSSIDEGSTIDCYGMGGIIYYDVDLSQESRPNMVSIVMPSEQDFFEIDTNQIVIRLWYEDTKSVTLGIKEVPTYV